MPETTARLRGKFFPPGLVNGEPVVSKAAQKVALSPARPDDRRKFYAWLCGWSDRTVYKELPSLKQMMDEDDYFYNGSAPEKGMYFIIHAGHEEIGCISHTCIHLKSGVAEFDIWLKDESVCGKGYGYQTIMLLLDHVRNMLKIHTVLIRPYRQNRRAIHVYKKCGFVPMVLPISAYMREEFLETYGAGDCGAEDTENLIRILSD